MEITVRVVDIDHVGIIDESFVLDKGNDGGYFLEALSHCIHEYIFQVQIEC